MANFAADSFIVADVVPSPTFDERKDGLPPDMILLHYTGMESGQAALDRLTSADSKVSSHYVVFEDGRIVQCVPEHLRAWHAGVSYWAGETDINSKSIGIEIVNGGHDFGYPALPAAPNRGGDFTVPLDPDAPPPGRDRPRARRIPTSRRRASRIPARSFRGSCSASPMSDTGSVRRRSTSRARASSPATGTTASRSYSERSRPMATRSTTPAAMTNRHALSSLRSSVISDKPASTALPTLRRC